MIVFFLHFFLWIRRLPKIVLLVVITVFGIILFYAEVLFSFFQEGKTTLTSAGLLLLVIAGIPLILQALFALALGLPVRGVQLKHREKLRGELENDFYDQKVFLLNGVIDLNIRLCIFLLDDNEELYIFARMGGAYSSAELNELRFAKNQGVVGDVFWSENESGNKARIEPLGNLEESDLRRIWKLNHRLIELTRDVMCIVAVPLVVYRIGKPERIGMLAIDSSQEGSYEILRELEIEDRVVTVANSIASKIKPYVL